MSAFKVDFTKVHEFADASAFDAWLATHHGSADEVWVKIHKVKTGLNTVTPAQAIEVALCWGWIDGIRKAFDEQSFLQRYTPRRWRSNWSRINAECVLGHMASGRMRPRGLAAVRLAILKGKWPDGVTIPKLPTSSTKVRG